MAQTGFTPIQLYRTGTASAAPSAANLADGELAINTNDGRLFYKDSGGVVRTVASNSSASGVFAAGTVSAPGITFTGDTNTGIYSPAADTIAFTEGGVEAMRIDSSGNVGIGTASPAARFDLAGDYKEGVVTANTSTAYTVSLAAGTVQILTLTANCVFTFPAATTAGRSFMLLLRQDATGSRTATWPATVKWPGGTAPTITATASRTDKFVFTADGTNWLGSNAGQNYSA